MFSALRKNIVGLLAGFMMVAVPVAVPVVAYAANTPVNIGDCVAGSTGDLSIGTGGACTPSSGTTQPGADRINNLIRLVVNIFSALVGIIAVIMIIFGGVKYITSGGDSGNVGAAKNTIIYAVIGLVVVALAQFLVQFVLNRINNSGTAGA